MGMRLSEFLSDLAWGSSVPDPVKMGGDAPVNQITRCALGRDLVQDAAYD